VKPMTMHTKFVPPNSELIHDVKVKPLRVVPDERGRLMEILRCDDDFFTGFGQVYLSTIFPGVVKAWHYHNHQEDRFTCVRGTVKAALYDDREDSPSRGRVNEFYVGEHNPRLIVIPPGIYHGWKCVGECEAYVINVPSKPYDRDDPDEFRIDAHDPRIPYDWTRKDG